MPDPLAWHTPETAQTQLGVVVTQAGLDVAREQCLRIKSLSLTTAAPPTASFAQGVVFQALANKQSTQADTGDEYGNATARVRLYPYDRKIMSLLIIPDPDPDDATRDRGYIGGLIG